MGGPIPDFELSEYARTTAREMYLAYPHEAARSAPGFTDLARRVIGGWASPELPDVPPLRDISRFSAAVIVAYLEATPGGLTLARMRAFIERHGLGGIGHGRAVLIFLRYLGLIEPLPREGDGRIQRYAVTARCTAMLRARFKREMAAVGDWDPVAAIIVDRLDDDTVFHALLTAVGELGIAVAQSEQTPENPVNLFSSRAGGLVLLCVLMQGASPDDRFPPRKSLQCNIAELSRRCRASRMQVRHLLNRARDAGLLHPEPDGQVRFSEELAQGIERLVASITALLVHSARRALAD